jgi:phosphoribosylformylglycinamidine cyclo-ligase
VKGLAHITGGGITENLPRILPEGCAAEINVRSWKPPAIFRLIQALGEIERDEMFRTFNMGVGMLIVCRQGDVEAVVKRAGHAGARASWLAGVVVPGDRTVRYVEGATTALPLEW